MQRRAILAARIFGLVLIVTFTLAGVWLATGIDGYAITSAIDPGAAANPLGKTVARVPGAWLANYHRFPAMIALPALAYLGTLAALALVGKGRTGIAFVASSLAMTGVIGTAGASLFPFIMPSSSIPSASLTVWDSTSSQLTLAIMLVAAVIFVPIIIGYTSWAYKVMAGKVTSAYIRENEHEAY